MGQTRAKRDRNLRSRVKAPARAVNRKGQGERRGPDAAQVEQEILRVHRRLRGIGGIVDPYARS